MLVSHVATISLFNLSEISVHSSLALDVVAKTAILQNLCFPFLPEHTHRFPFPGSLRFSVIMWLRGNEWSVSRNLWLSFQAWPIKTRHSFLWHALFPFWVTEAATPSWPWKSHVKDGRAALSLDSCTTTWNRTTYLNLPDSSISTVWSHCMFVSVLLAQPHLPELMQTVTRTSRMWTPQETPVCVVQTSRKNAFFYCGLWKVLCSVSDLTLKERFLAVLLSPRAWDLHLLSLSPRAARSSANSCSKCT